MSFCSGFLSLAVLAGIISFSAPVSAQQETTPPPAAAPAAVLAPCDTTAPAAPAPEPVKEADPCAAYAGSPEAYVVCHDQLNKIKRMMDAQGQGDVKNNPAPIPAPEQAAPAAASPVPEVKKQ